MWRGHGSQGGVPFSFSLRGRASCAYLINAPMLWKFQAIINTLAMDLVTTCNFQGVTGVRKLSPDSMLLDRAF